MKDFENLVKETICLSSSNQYGIMIVHEYVPFNLLWPAYVYLYLYNLTYHAQKLLCESKIDNKFVCQENFV